MEIKINGTKIKAKAGRGVMCEKWGGSRRKYVISVTINGVTKRFNYYDSIANSGCDSLEDDGIKCALYCIFMDATTIYEFPYLEDFMRGLGYDDIKEGRKVYDACKKTLSKLEEMNLTRDEMFEFINEL